MARQRRTATKKASRRVGRKVGGTTARRATRKAVRMAKSNRSQKFKNENFNKHIEQIKDKISPRHRINASAINMVNLFLNDMLKNVTEIAKKNCIETSKKVITFVDVLVATMELYGDKNKRINDIMAKAESKSDLYRDKIAFSKVGKKDYEPPNTTI